MCRSVKPLIERLLYSILGPIKGQSGDFIFVTCFITQYDIEFHNQTIVYT